MPRPHLIQRPHGGLNHNLVRKEYLLSRTMQQVLARIAEGVDVGENNPTDALANFNDRRKSLTGPAFRALVYQYTNQTAIIGIHDADRLLARTRFKRPTPIGGKAKITPTPSIKIPTPPALNSVLQGWGTVVDKITDHTLDHFDRIAGDFKDRLKDTLKEGYANGEGVRDLKNRVEDALGIDSRRATERARTLTMETYNQAHLVQYNEVGIPGVQFLAAGDERECDICGDLDGTIWTLDDSDIVRPPVHNYCRCTLLPYVEEVPAGSGLVSDETMDFCKSWREDYFDIPAYA
jgi:SPP1 gp7 family putative phage head morphogenesis protein